MDLDSTVSLLAHLLLGCSAHGSAGGAVASSVRDPVVAVGLAIQLLHQHRKARGELSTQKGHESRHMQELTRSSNY